MRMASAQALAIIGLKRILKLSCHDGQIDPFLIQNGSYFGFEGSICKTMSSAITNPFELIIVLFDAGDAD